MKTLPRIIAGSHRNHSLTIPTDSLVRPTQERTRRSVFDILGDRIWRGPFLDLFAGSGIMGFEALSRGVPMAVFVERDRELVSCMKRNYRNLGFSQSAFFYMDDVIKRVMPICDQISFSHIYIDPPYQSDAVHQTLTILSTCRLDEECVVMAEHHHKVLLAEAYPTIRLTRQERYGETAVTFWKKMRTTSDDRI